MKPKLKRVPNKLGRHDVTRAKLKKAGAVPFDEVSKLLTKGETNVVLMDLTGKQVPVEADCVGTKGKSEKKKRTRATKLEVAIKKALDKNDLDVDIDGIDVVAFIVGESCGVEGWTRPKHYKPRTL